jgi:hypothetical protein
VADGPAPAPVQIVDPAGGKLDESFGPTQSDRRIASKHGVSPTTAGKVRQELESTGELSTVDRWRGAEYEAKIKRGCELEPVTGFFRFGTDVEPAVARLLALRHAGEERRLESYRAYRRPR